MHPLLERQKHLEDDAMAEGSLRFRRRLEKAAEAGRGTQVGAARKLLQMAIQPLAADLQEYCDGAKKKRGAKHTSIKWIEMVGYETLAYMAVKVVLDGVSGQQHGLKRQYSVTKAAVGICDLFLDELHYRRFQEKAPALFDYKIDHFTTSNYTHMRRVMDAAIGFATDDQGKALDMSDLQLSQQQKLIIGTQIVTMMINATHLVEVEQVFVPRQSTRSHGHTDTFLVPTPDTVKWIMDRNDALEFLWPVNMPMVVPPRAWTPTQRGGYRFALRDKHALARGLSKEQEAKTAAADMPTVYAAVNRIQETAWKINPNVYQLVLDIQARGGDMAGIGRLVDEEVPAKPFDIAHNKESRAVWRKKAHGVKERNHARKAKAMEFTKTLSMATAMKDDAALFFPCNLDFRGRVYPICNFLSPQGDDLSKSLLTFSVGKPLGTDGAGWLALHGANCLGETPDGIKLSKATLHERVEWIVAHTTIIERVANDPFGDLWWAAETVDNPLQFFAFACEWSAFASAKRSGVSDEWVCGLPCAMDGTCNGLQHFAAMLRDPIGGMAVNVIPTDRPQDIYQRICDGVLTALEVAASTDQLARVWLTSGLVSRKLTKQPTMTFGYGSKKFGFKKQLIAYLAGLHSKEVRAHFATITDEGKEKSQIPEACGYMSTLIWDALQSTVVAASQGMKWMQDSARIVTKSGKCVAWTVPATGFPVKQDYHQCKRSRVNTILAGKLFQPSVYTDTQIPDAPKQANAIAPNFVHSLDAAALMMTVEMAGRSGVSSFGMIHDSYATLPADCEELARCTRQAFHDLYVNYDVVEDLGRQLQAQCKEDAELPVSPARGSLDLSGVLRSEYFFS